MPSAQPLDMVLPFAVLILPLSGFVALALFGDWIKRDHEETGAGYLACGAVLVAFGLAIWSTLRVYGWPAGPGGLRFGQPALGWPPFGALEQRSSLEWIAVGSLRIPFSLLVDPLSCVMMLVVSGIGSLIHVYSLGYMAEDEDRVRYFSYLNLFTFFMLLLVLAGSLPLLFVGWEGVGLCSYLLIGFWYRRESASRAGLKAFLVNRIGDLGLILGMVFIFHAFGSLDLVDLADNASAFAPEPLWEWGPLTIACLLLLIGAIGKSAQIPLHVWLPDAMEGPTPVSALIHAATMVTAGVYLVARLAPLYRQSETAMLVVAVLGAATALMAATIAVVQTDIKRVLAYSTVSQLGFMFLAAGVGVFGAAVFHLFTHAFFKALLFLGAGSVIHALSGEQDMRRMGGLWRKVPWTFGSFLVGTLAIAGIPLFAGFYSKDEILAGAYGTGHTVLFGVALFTALLTAAYMTRLVIMTFFGPFRGSPETERHVHESPASMLVPLLLLAAGSLAAGYAWFPRSGVRGGPLVRLSEVVQPALRVAEPRLAHAPWLPVVAALAAVVGIVLAWYLYLAMPELRRTPARLLAPALRLARRKYFFDDLYDGLVTRVLLQGSEALLWKRVDAGLIDETINRGARLVAAWSAALRALQSGLVRHYALLVLAGAVAVLSYLLWASS